MGQEQGSGGRREMIDMFCTDWCSAVCGSLSRFSMVVVLAHVFDCASFCPVTCVGSALFRPTGEYASPTVITTPARFRKVLPTVPGLTSTPTETSSREGKLGKLSHHT